MRQLNQAILVYFGIFAALALSGCGGSQSSINAAAPSPGGNAAGTGGSYGKQTQFAFPVLMRPQQPIEPEFKSASIALPTQLPQLLTTGRTTSADGETIEVLAAGYSPGLHNSHIELKGDYLVFSPVWHDEVYDRVPDIAFATFDVDLTGYAGASTIGFDWTEPTAPRREEKLWVGLSRWDLNRWQFFEGPLDDVLTLESLAPYTNEEGRVLILLGVLFRERVAVLEQLTIGAPEVRGTGLEVSQVELTYKVPPMFVPDLPTSVDLSSRCAPIADQGSWGSCTAFAVGNGAYNFELGKIYEGIGWNLNNPTNRVSAKYLYIVSGEMQGFPPTPDIGRWTDIVARDMAFHGVPSESKVPYNLVYDNDWSAPALEEAELLKNTTSYDLPCRTDSGIDTVKGVLAFYDRPVFLSTSLDYEFFYYEPGTVWNYQGPSYGGHAMLIVGYDDEKQAFKVRNSWSEDWGDNGYVWISYATLKNPYNWYVQCGALVDEYDTEVSEHFLGTAFELLPPASFSASDGSAALAVELNWTAAAQATGYRVYRDSITNQIANLGNVTSFKDTEASDGLSHAYWVSSVLNTQESALGAPDLGYTAPIPEVVSVMPQSGAEGVQVIFTPEAVGSPPVTFAWDFGGGAIPNTSTASMPQVVLAGEGLYDASVTISSPSGSDTFEFELEVVRNLKPLIYYEVPEAGDAPALIQFDAVEWGLNDPDGDLVLYEWDWNDDGVYDFVSTTPVGEHTYETPGEYSMTFRVMDDAGATETKEYHFVVTDPDANVLPSADFTMNPNESYLEPPVTVNFDGSLSSDSDGTLVNYEWDFNGDGIFDVSGPDKVQVQHEYTADMTGTIKLRVTDNRGDSDERTMPHIVGMGAEHEGWEHYPIFAEGSDAWSIYVDNAVIGGVPALVVWDDENRDLRYLYSTVGNPDATEDWSIENLDVSGDATTIFSLKEINGKAVVSYSLQGTGLYYSRRDGGGWSKHLVKSGTDEGVASSIALVNGKPAICYTNNVGVLRYARASQLEPTAAAHWTDMPVADFDDSRYAIDLIDVSGVPHAAVNNAIDSVYMCYALADGVDPTLAGDWSWHVVDTDFNTGSEGSLALVDGKPAIAYTMYGGNSEFRFAQASVTSPDATEDWTVHVVSTDSGQPFLEIIDGVPVAGCVRGPGWFRTTLATATVSSPTAASDWSFETFAETDACVGLFNLGNEPALLFEKTNSYKLYFLHPDA